MGLPTAAMRSDVLLDVTTVSPIFSCEVLRGEPLSHTLET
ncbi:hypothetical protein DAD186_05160 [Dermabacter vaginalis]|uniref:Uncharacterized protein n=1 Tax=Dermabacter vaginalis TaxID=1630135 RepID=A0A1B0ZGL5_9MICO|nr:hypothetical protein DAD186_05160 [Dermabacter vaginalis]